MSPVRKPSLRMDDTFENINELGTLELMSKDPELASYGPLKKSVSTDSLCSISSIGNNFGQEFTVGQVEVNMEYNVNSNTFHVTLLQGKDLMGKENVNFESCFVRISLLPDEQIVGISRVSVSTIFSCIQGGHQKVFAFYQVFLPHEMCLFSEFLWCIIVSVVEVGLSRRMYAGRFSLCFGLWLYIRYLHIK